MGGVNRIFVLKETFESTHYLPVRTKTDFKTLMSLCSGMELVGGWGSQYGEKIKLFVTVKNFDIYRWSLGQLEVKFDQSANSSYRIYASIRPWPYIRKKFARGSRKNGKNIRL